MNEAGSIRAMSRNTTVVVESELARDCDRRGVGRAATWLAHMLAFGGALLLTLPTTLATLFEVMSLLKARFDA